MDVQGALETVLLELDFQIFSQTIRCAEYLD